MHILFVTEGILGSAETFILRQAKALKKAGHTVSVFVFYKHRYSKTIHQSIAPDIDVIIPDIPFSWLSKHIDSVVHSFKIDYSLRKNSLRASLRKTVKHLNPDIIHSNLLVADRIATSVGHELHIPVVSTIHGDYIQYFNNLKQEKHVPVLNYKQKVTRNLTLLNRIVCTSETQINFFKHYFPNIANDKIVKIYTGYEKPAKRTTDSNLRQKLQIPASAFVFGQLTRGIKEKGWENSIQAFLQLRNDDAHLVLVGTGDYLGKLRKKYSVYKNIHFVAKSGDPIQWINIFDVALLPTTYFAESLPNDIMDYLYCGKPVIASDAGEIKNMLRYKDKDCGMAVTVRDGIVATSEITAVMQKYLSNKELYDTHKKNTEICLEQFNLEDSIRNYLGVYEGALLKTS